MNNKKIRSSRWAILPLLFCSVTVLAGDNGEFEPYGQLPPPMQGELMLEDDAAAATPKPQVADTAPDTQSQAKALGQEADGFVDDVTETSNLNTGYVGGNTRIGIGIDTELKGKADISQVIHKGEGSTTTGQGYVGFNPKAEKDKGEETLTGAGAKLNHHWVSTDEKGQATRVNKVFSAYDQNEQKDKKITAGYGQENEQLFWSGHVSKGLSDKRVTGTATNGSTVFEKAYDYGVGGRVGTYLPDQQMRVQGGLDYEWGKEFTDTEKRPAQATLSGGVEKFFPNTPHSVGAEVEVYKKSGGYAEGDQKADARGGVNYRYDIASDAGIWQENQQFKRVRVEIPGEEIKQQPKMGQKLVKHTMELEADTFFELDKAKLTPEAHERLKAVIAQIRASGHEGNIRISGNTCDLGSDKHNLDLSTRRANAVRDFMAKNGFSSTELLAEGLGEAQPKYPNTKTERHKNRRVDIEYVNYQNEYKDEVIEEGGTTKTDPKVVWRKELIPSPPLWVRQALNNTIDHKQSVDTYKTTAGSSNTNVLKAENDGPFTTTSGTPIPVDVLGNDIYPDKAALAIVSYSQGTGGGVTQVGDNLVYTPTTTFTGTDTFTYTIKDPAGNQSTATVTVIVNAGACSLAANPNSETVEEGSVDNVLPVFANDTVCGSSNTKITGVVNPSTAVETPVSTTKGTVRISSDGKTLIYTPNAGATGEDSFKYTITDEKGNTSTATVTVKLAPAVSPGVAPVVANDTKTVEKGAVNEILGILGNDTIPDGETVQIIITKDPAHGTLTVKDGWVEYTPDATYDGADTFDYKVKSNQTGLESSVATVTLEACATCHACPVESTKTGDVSYTFSNKVVDIKYIKASDYIDAGAEIESVTFTESGSVAPQMFYATTTSGSSVYAGRLDIQSDNSIKFTPSAGTYCKEGTFDFYIKLKDCATPTKVTITITQID